MVYSFHVGINRSLYFVHTQLVSWYLQKLALLPLPHCLMLKKNIASRCNYRC